MRARVRDRENDTYYISEVYGVINRAGDWYMVDHPNDKSRVSLVEYCDFSKQGIIGTNIEIIDINPFPSEQWIYLDKLKMTVINEKLKNSKPLHYYRGFAYVWEAEEALVQLLENGTAEKKSLHLKDISTKLAGWNYIETDDDINELMTAYSGFHDAVIKELSYISGEYFDKDEGVMYLEQAGAKQVKVVFNSDWADELEMVLLAPRIVHLIPGEENCFSDIMYASLILKDTMVYFFDSEQESVDDTFGGTYFKSMGMMWRIKNS